MRKPYSKRKCLPVEVIFWRSVNKEGECWEWTGCLDEYGYAHMNHKAFKTRKASRISYFLHHGPFDDHLKVLHTCDNPKCVRVDHLYLGTQRRNGRDMAERGRSAWGEKNGQSKLSAVQIGEIIEALKDCKNEYGIQKTLAKRYGVDPSHISRIKSGHNWNRMRGVENVSRTTHSKNASLHN